MENFRFEEKDFLACCGSHRFAKEMASLSPFPSLDASVQSAREIWFNNVDVNGWLEAFSAHPQIGHTPAPSYGNATSAQWSKGEQSAAFATATQSSLQELADWNVKYKEKFGFVFLICASGRSTPEILTELKRRYSNRPIIEFENAAQEQMKITELRLAKLFSAKANPSTGVLHSSTAIEKAGEDRITKIGTHLAAAASREATQQPTRTRPPITTHILDVARGSPASGVEVRLERWEGKQTRPYFGKEEAGGWTLLGESKTDKDGRSVQLMNIVDSIAPGLYKISFNTGEYNPNGFYPFVSVAFEIRESQKFEHFHVPLLVSPFSFSTYRGS
ncbi:hypothetical protein V2J09_023451 [Rumex salicifolius]